jgi:hypothetical protein
MNKFTITADEGKIDVELVPSMVHGMNNLYIGGYYLLYIGGYYLALDTSAEHIYNILRKAYAEHDDYFPAYEAHRMACDLITAERDVLQQERDNWKEEYFKLLKQMTSTTSCDIHGSINQQFTKGDRMTNHEINNYGTMSITYEPITGFDSTGDINEKFDVKLHDGEVKTYCRADVLKYKNEIALFCPSLPPKKRLRYTASYSPSTRMWEVYDHIQYCEVGRRLSEAKAIAVADKLNTMEHEEEL